MPQFDSLRAHLVAALADLLDSERQLIRAFPKLTPLAATSQLRGVLEAHLAQTPSHIARLRQAFEALHESPDSIRSACMKALLDETVTVTTDAAEGPIRDAFLIASAQRLEHYEIAGYSAARTMAEVMGLPAIVRLLARTLKEERSVTQALAQIADGSVNRAAAVEWRAEQAHRETFRRRRTRSVTARRRVTPARASRRRRKN